MKPKNNTFPQAQKRPPEKSSSPQNKIKASAPPHKEEQTPKRTPLQNQTHFALPSPMQSSEGQKSQALPSQTAILFKTPCMASSNHPQNKTKPSAAEPKQNRPQQKSRPWPLQTGSAEQRPVQSPPFRNVLAASPPPRGLARPLKTLFLGPVGPKFCVFRGLARPLNGGEERCFGRKQIQSTKTYL